MDIVDTYTDVPDTVNEKLAARKFAIEYLQELGEGFEGSPTGVDICARLGLHAVNRKQASIQLLQWAANRRIED